MKNHETYESVVGYYLRKEDGSQQKYVRVLLPDDSIFDTNEFISVTLQKKTSPQSARKTILNMGIGDTVVFGNSQYMAVRCAVSRFRKELNRGYIVHKDSETGCIVATRNR